MKARKIDDNLLLQMIDEGKSQKEIAAYFGCSPAAVCKRLKKLSVSESYKKLSNKERTFVTEIVSGRSQTQAALLAYDVTNRESAKAIGHRLMKDTDIKTAVAELMQEEGLTRRYRVQRLKSHVNDMDPHVSLKALDQSWKLDGAYIDNQVQVKVDVNQLLKDVKDIDGEIERLEAEIKVMEAKESST